MTIYALKSLLSGGLMDERFSLSASNEGVNMRISHVITKITAGISKYYFTKYIYVVFCLLIAVAYPYQIFAANASNIQTKQSSRNETISGAFGIKFGEDIKPYLEGHYSNRSDGVPELKDFNVPQNTFRYKVLKLPINEKEIFYSASNTGLLGISDDNGRVVKLYFFASWGPSDPIWEQDGEGQRVIEFLREKYKITKPKQDGNRFEEYGDVDGNNIRIWCSKHSFNLTYTSHLMLDYITRIKIEQQKKIDDTKKSLKGF